MKTSLLLAGLLATLSFCTAALAADEYNDVPAGDRQYAQCISTSNKKWEGGTEKSPIKGQSKAEAFCTCLWNETPDNFRGNLATFSESTRGKSVNKICEKYADWYDN